MGRYRTTSYVDVLLKEVDNNKGFCINAYQTGYERFSPLFDRYKISDNVEFFKKRMEPAFVLTRYKLSKNNKRLEIVFKSEKSLKIYDSRKKTTIDYNSITLLYDISECDEITQTEYDYGVMNMMSCVIYLSLSDTPITDLDITPEVKDISDDNLGKILSKEIRYFDKLNRQEPKVIKSECDDIVSYIAENIEREKHYNYIKLTEKEISELSGIFQLSYVRNDYETKFHNNLFDACFSIDKNDDEKKKLEETKEITFVRVFKTINDNLDIIFYVIYVDNNSNRKFFWADSIESISDKFKQI